MKILIYTVFTKQCMTIDKNVGFIRKENIVKIVVENAPEEIKYGLGDIIYTHDDCGDEDYFMICNSSEGFYLISLLDGTYWEEPVKNIDEITNQIDEFKTVQLYKSDKTTLKIVSE